MKKDDNVPVQASAATHSLRPNVLVRRILPDIAPEVMTRLVGDLLSADDLTPIRRIVIKINLCEYRRPESGAVTDPVMLKALVVALQRWVPGRPVMLAESDATSLDADSAFRYMSIDRVAEETGAELLNFSKSDDRVIPIPEGEVFKELRLAKLLDAATLYVNFAKLKVNSGTKITGCLKNNYALIKDKNKAQYHAVVDAAICDVNVALGKTGVRLLCLIDGYIGMETMGGPAFGRPKKCGIVLGSRDPVAVDACETRIIGMSPGGIGHLVRCARAGLGTMRYALSTDIQNFQYKDYRFRFEAVQYWLRQKLKKHAGIGL